MTMVELAEAVRSHQCESCERDATACSARGVLYDLPVTQDHQGNWWPSVVKLKGGFRFTCHDHFAHPERHNSAALAEWEKSRLEKGLAT